MADSRYNRWQSAAIAQLTVAVALISSLSIAGMGLGVSLLKDKDFSIGQPEGTWLAFALLLLFLAALFSSVAIVTRLLDFRLTAREVRSQTVQGYNRPLRILWLDADDYGRLTWGIFWAACACFGLGAVLLAMALIEKFGPVLLR